MHSASSLFLWWIHKAREPPFACFGPGYYLGKWTKLSRAQRARVHDIKTTKQAKKWHINQNSNPSWHKQPVYRCPPSADGYSPTKRNCGKWAYLHRPRYCHPWLSDTFARNTASTSIEPHKTKKNEKIRKEQKGEERNRKPFLFFVVPLSSKPVNIH